MPDQKAEARAQNRYRVIRSLESGGMAQVFLGESESVAGFKKAVAIKRVLPHLASNEKFIRMFLDEARVSARLSHANIVQVFDIGHVDNTYFIVMEYVDGVNLKAVVEFLRGRGKTIPMPVACHISQKVCEGLFYAHEATDSEGASLHIVHRDISPPNVLLSRRGEIKIVDFGLAKAAHSVEKTEPGIVKGKFSYLAPETASGQEADPQADIFAVGIMLWEMLAGRKLFQGDTDYQTVKLVQQAAVPSLRTINPSVPEELEVILRKALARDKQDRYVTAQALAEELTVFLVTNKLKASAFDVSRMVADVLSEKAAASKVEGRESNVIDNLIQDELLRFTSLGEPSSGPTDRLSPATHVADGARPLDASEFVNPADWTRDADFDPTTVSRRSWVDAEPGGGTVSGNLADELEGPDEPPLPGGVTVPSDPAPSLTSSPAGGYGDAGSGAHALERSGGRAPSAAGRQRYNPLTVPPGARRKRFPAAVIALLVLVILVGVAAGLIVSGVLKLPA
jgi:serine/threonine-protein kinase